MILLDPDARPIIGHRGASAECPENTLMAFRRAVEAGADAIEYDVRASGDSRAVVIHDDTLDRTTNGSGLVARYPLEALRDFDAGGGESIPTLDEVLEEFGTLPQIIELKEPRVAAAVRQAIERHGAAHHVLLGSFDRRALGSFDRRRYSRSASRADTAGFFAASRLRIPLGGGYRAFCVPERSGAIHLVDKKFVACARRAGKPVHVWTVDDAAQATALRRLGVAGIITNDPRGMARPAISKNP